MAFKMKYSNGGFPYKSPLKDNKLTKEQWEKDKENLPGSYWDDKTNSMKIKPTMGTAGPIDAGKKLWSLGKKLFTS